MLLWLAPAIAFAIVLPLALMGDRNATSPVEEPEYVVVGERSRDLRLDVVAIVELAPLRDLASPTSGTVTSISAAFGSAPQHGSTVAAINGIEILAEVGGSPLYRELRQGDRGPDVATLKSLLAARGFTVSEGDLFDWGTGQAVRALRAAIGAPAGNTFGPTYVMHLPVGAVIATANVAVGDVVSQGTSLFELADDVIGVSIEPADSSRTLDQFEENAVTVSTRGQSVNLTSVNVSGSEADQEALVGFIRGGLLDGTLKRDEAGKIAGLTIALTQPRTVGTVPIAAVYVSDEGTLCVFTSDDADGVEAVNLRQAPPSTEVGVAYVDAGLINREVVLNPSGLDAEVLAECT